MVRCSPCLVRAIVSTTRSWRISLDISSRGFRGEHFADFAALKVEIEAYIDWYNTDRRQERLKGMTPMEYRCHTLAA